jgi:hypothetical protein
MDESYKGQVYDVICNSAGWQFFATLSIVFTTVHQDVDCFTISLFLMKGPKVTRRAGYIQ